MTNCTEQQQNGTCIGFRHTGYSYWFSIILKFSFKWNHPKEFVNTITKFSVYKRNEVAVYGYIK